jgi:hypothetical protein
MNRSDLLLIGIICVGSLVFPTLAQAETLVESSIFFRIYVNLRVDQKTLQAWLPDPWRAVSVPGGPLKGSNLWVVFDDRFLSQDGEGKPVYGGTNRPVILVAFAKHPQTGKVAVFVLRVYRFTDDPGAYKNGVKATVSREAKLQGTNMEPGAGSEVWKVQDSAGGRLEFRMDYQRAVPKRMNRELRVHSNVEPDFFRIYRDDRTSDVVKSIPAGIDRVKNYKFKVTMTELSKMFDGSEQLVGISVNPCFVRQVFLP